MLLDKFHKQVPMRGGINRNVDMHAKFPCNEVYIWTIMSTNWQALAKLLCPLCRQYVYLPYTWSLLVNVSFLVWWNEGFGSTLHKLSRIHQQSHAFMG